MANPLKLKYAVTHGPIKVPDAPQVGPTLNAVTINSLPGVPMTLEDGVVKLEILNRTTNKTVNVYVPLSNFSHFQLED
jgi:hypothetical protein